MKFIPSFIAWVLAIASVCYGSTLIWDNVAPDNYKTSGGLPLTIYLLVFSFVMMFTLSKALSNPDKNRFTYLFMLFTGVKLFLNLMIIVVYAVFAQDSLKNFVLTFLPLYFLFLLFEVVFLMRQLRNQANIN